MLCTRMSVLQRKENVQIQISHSRCKHKKELWRQDYRWSTYRMSYFTIILSAQYQKIFVPKCNKPDRENVEIQEKDCKEKTHLRQHFPAISVLSLWRPGRVRATELGRKATVKEATCGRSNNLVGMPCVISPLCKICCSILGEICAEQRWWGGKEENRTEMGELCNLKGTWLP